MDELSLCIGTCERWVVGYGSCRQPLWRNVRYHTRASGLNLPVGEFWLNQEQGHAVGDPSILAPPQPPSALGNLVKRAH